MFLSDDDARGGLSSLTTPKADAPGCNNRSTFSKTWILASQSERNLLSDRQGRTCYVTFWAMQSAAKAFAAPLCKAHSPAWEDLPNPWNPPGNIAIASFENQVRPQRRSDPRERQRSLSAEFRVSRGVVDPYP